MVLLVIKGKFRHTLGMPDHPQMKQRVPASFLNIRGNVKNKNDYNISRKILFIKEFSNDQEYLVVWLAKKEFSQTSRLHRRRGYQKDFHFKISFN